MIEMSTDIYEKILNWAANGGVGISSNTMLFAVTGKSVYGDSRGIPRDWADFNRCLDLCRMIPEVEENIRMVPEKFPNWEPIVREWDALKLIHGNTTGGTMFYDALHSLYDECMECDGWTKDGHSWVKK